MRRLLPSLSPQDGDIPSKRSGHSFSVVGTNAFLFGGCTNQKPAGPNSDLYQLKMGTGNFIWVKLDKGVRAANVAITADLCM